MAHGSKKWIVDATGHSRKSKDRTKKDYYARVTHWEEYTNSRTKYGRFGNWKVNDHGDFCPQCKGIQKEYDAERNAGKRKYELEYAMYEADIAEAKAQWEMYDRKRMHQYYNKVTDQWLFAFPMPPKVSRPPQFWEWKRVQERLDIDTSIPSRWSYHWRNTLCYKHERWQEASQQKWYGPYNGNRAHYGWSVKNCRKMYRNKVKNVMQRAKYVADYEGYDAILPRRRPWLD